MKNLAFSLLIFAFPCLANTIDIVTGQQSLEFHGYFRSSLGFSEDGDTQAKFQLPGARAKYRLGNEPDTNMELQFDYTYGLKDPENKDAHIKSVIMLDGFANQGDSNSFSLSHLAQAYLSFNKILNNNVDIWFGRRYYQRKSIHIMNHFWLNPGQNSHAGVGFEKLPLGSGELDMALFRNEDDFTIGGNPYLINSTVIDSRWHSLALTENLKLTAWAQVAHRSALPSLNYAKRSGYTIGGWIDYKSAQMKNTTALLYQTGAAITQSGTNPRTVREDQGWNLDKANTIEINNMLTYESSPDYSFQWSLLYRQDDRGASGNSDIKWYSTGIRPIFYFSKHMNLALEAGVDYVDDEVNNRSGSLIKFTTALQISANRGFKSRPVLRFFVTLADWDDDFRGLVGNIPGNAPYGNDTFGWTLGAQVETWW